VDIKGGSADSFTKLPIQLVSSHSQPKHQLKMAAQRIEKVYNDAVASGLLPGASLIAGDKDGNVVYSKCFGKDSVKEDARPFTTSTISAIASMTKLMTSVAAVKAVEEGLIDLDRDLRPMLPEMGKFGVMTGFDDETNTAILEESSEPITLRILLTHTSGHEYDLMHPFLAKWRASRGEEPWVGATIAQKASIPLLYVPGTGFSYGPSHEWAGKAIEAASGMTLEAYMREKIWVPLGIEKDASFWPKLDPGMKSRMASTSTLSAEGDGPAVDAPAYDIVAGAEECMGGAGVWASSDAYYTFLSAVFRRDSRLLSSASFDELFRPQLNDTTEEALNRFLNQSPVHMQVLRLQIPESVRMTWCFAGMVAKESQQGRFDEGTVFWGGLPCLMWYMDFKAGVCGTAFSQVVPPMSPKIVQLHQEFQKAVYDQVKSA
jgi:CubicO group peptidase (beta-lactamase class C family)